MIARVKVGDRVKAHWYVNDHLRLAAIERLNGAAEKEQEKSEKKEGAGGEADGFAGMLAGKVLERIERGIKIEVTRIAEVWKHSQARRPEALIGKKVCVRVDPGIYARKENSEKYRMLVWTFFGSLAAGQEEVFDVKHLEGDNFLFLELTEEQRQRCARLQEGGEVIGTVVAKERNWIEVKPEGDGPAERYMARWIGGAPKDGGGPDREMLAAIERIQIGDRVRVRWTFDERKRVIALERLSAAKGETPKTIPPAEGDGKKDVWDELEKALRESAR
ncbi:MAG: hypothetical protein N3A66_06510, partial [Planctomycetota bacterium]|nr:hypothetical protein [Planctomycetota bacterium]